MEDPIVAESAFKHGLTEDETLHVYRNPIRAWEVMTMPRTVEEILAHADQLAARFEDYEPSPDDEIDVTAIRQLRAAVAERSAAERHLLNAVKAAREAGMSWASIGTVVGTTGEAARQRYGSRVA